MTEYASRDIEPTERPLARDLRLLGWQLRRLVRRHGGTDLWDTLHGLRELAERRMLGDESAGDEMATRLAGLSADQLAELTRTVGLFFDLTNLAEDRHRVRVLDRRERAGTRSETIADAAGVMREAGLGPDEVSRRVGALHIEPVLTAHPTEAKRRSIRRALRRLRRDLVRLDHADASRSARRAQLTRMQRDLASLWYTDPVSPRKPQVMEELRRTMFAARTLWRVTPRLMTQLRDAFPDQAETLCAPGDTITFGNWVGGDRDGNPYVTTAVTRRTLRVLRRTAVRLHRRECRRVRERLTVSDARGGRPTQLIARIEEARNRWPMLRPKLDRLHPNEWFVHWLVVIDARLRHSVALPDEATHDMAYPNAEALVADVDELVQGLVETDHTELLGGALQRWRDRLGGFGLRLFTLDVRVNSVDAARALSDILRQVDPEVDYLAADEDERRNLLQTYDEATAAGVADRSVLPEVSADLVRLFSMLQKLVEAGGAEALGPVIISMTHQPSDVLAVRWLIRFAARCEGLSEPLPHPIAPLFETIDDLERSHGMLDILLQDKAYRRDVASLGDEQICMIGYSDSAKDGGYLTSNWSLYRGQQKLCEAAQVHGVRVTPFHGRGGAIGRGGGPAARAILSLPPESVQGRLRLTEQGEVIAERYDDPAVARRHLEQLIWGTLTLGVEQGELSAEESSALATDFAARAEQAYRALIDDEFFTAYMRQCTALPLIETLRIGSRPSRRSASARFEDLRAIPFTFAWNQVRMPINAFFGLGAGFAALDAAQRQRLAELYPQWPWLRAVIDNAELALGRSDPAMGRRYVALAEDPDAAMPLWQRLGDEHRQARDAILAIKSQDRLLERVTWLRRALRVRKPYVDILNLIQIELMARQRRGDTDEAVEHALRRTVQGIAAGLRNTG